MMPPQPVYPMMPPQPVYPMMPPQPVYPMMPETPPPPRIPLVGEREAVAGPSGIHIPTVPITQHIPALSGVVPPEGPPEMPREVQTVLSHIGKVSTGSQTEPFLKTMREIQDLISKYPELKDVIVNALLSEMIKNRNFKKEDIEAIKRMYDSGKPFIAKFEYRKPTKVTIVKPFNIKSYQVTNIMDYENLIPSSATITRF